MDDLITDLQNLSQPFPAESAPNPYPDVNAFLRFANDTFSHPSCLSGTLAGSVPDQSTPFALDVSRGFQTRQGHVDMGSGMKGGIPMLDSAEISYPSVVPAERNNGMGGRKRKRKNTGEANKPREVIHVRAKRGQATDSHSLAERVRRERINEKLRALQDLVPGCYKAMGMALMLDVIINYVRSLQNQIEFLSMKLTAASLFYDLNSLEAEAVDALQRTNPSKEIERMLSEGYYEGLPDHPHSASPN